VTRTKKKKTLEESDLTRATKGLSRSGEQFGRPSTFVPRRLLKGGGENSKVQRCQRETRWRVRAEWNSGPEKEEKDLACSMEGSDRKKWERGGRVEKRCMGGRVALCGKERGKKARQKKGLIGDSSVAGKGGL